MVLAAVRLILQRLKDRLPRVMAALVEAEEGILAHISFPAEHWRELSSTNPLERLNKETNRRTRVVGIYLCEKSLIRLVAALLPEQNDERAVSRRYMGQHSPARLHQSEHPEIQLIFLSWSSASVEQRVDCQEKGGALKRQQLSRLMRCRGRYSLPSGLGREDHHLSLQRLPPENGRGCPGRRPCFGCHRTMGEDPVRRVPPQLVGNRYGPRGDATFSSRLR
jgi:hypothetical protein